MKISNNNIYSPSSPSIQKDLRMTNSRVFKNRYKEAYRLDINPIYLNEKEEKVSIFDTDVLYYIKSLLTFKKPF